MDELRALLAQHGIKIAPTFTGEYIRFESQFFKGLDLGGGVMWANFGDWSKKGCKITWSGAGGKALTPEQDAQVKAALQAAEVERKRFQEEVAAQAELMWLESTDRAPMDCHPYFLKKKLSSLHGSRLWINPQGHPVILVPMRDSQGKLWNVTRIFSKEFIDEKTGEARGNKFVLKGGRKEGLFHTLGDVGASDIILAEGFATGASLKEAFPSRTVLVCFDAGNLEAAAEAYCASRKDRPQTLLIGADDDVYKPEKGNAGREAATLVAGRFSAEVRYPLFKDTRTLPTDWNDLHCLEGLDAVRWQFENPPAEHSDSQQGGSQSPSRRKGQHPESAITAQLLSAYGNRLLKQDRDVFEWLEDEQHWRHYHPRVAADYFQKIIDLSLGQGLKFKEIQSIYQRFLTHLPYAPEGRNLFAPPPFVTNFQNGALELLPTEDGSFKLEFRKKRQEDLLCYTHPFDYAPDAPLNTEFEETVARVLEPEMVSTYYEVLGACLIPAFPKVALAIGKPGGGKSTLIMMALHMIDQKLQCSVDPSDWRGFGMETMAGKLVNLHTDIALSRPIAENILKLIEDRIPVRIQRKGVTDVYAPLPALHFFGANGLPRTQESTSPFARRTVIFRCDKFQPPKTEYRKDWAHYVWSLGSGGVVRRALEGAARLAKQKGHFSRFDASEKAMAQWADATSDWVQKFVEDLAAGDAVTLDTESKAMLHEKGQMTRPNLIKIFYSWFEAHAPRQIPPDAFQLYSRLRELGFVDKKIKGVRIIEGFGVKATPNSLY